MTDAESGRVRVWLVERTYSDDELNVVIEVYATPEGDRYVRRERSLTTFSGGADTTAAIEVAPGRLAPVADADLRERYATEATRMRREHEPDDVI